MASSSSVPEAEDRGVELLPEELLLDVLGRLDSRQLLQVRRVCRRWRRVALGPRLWWSRRLDWGMRDRDRGLWDATLRLAPCASYLSVSGQEAAQMPTGVRCAVSRLRLCVPCYGIDVPRPHLVAKATDVLRNQLRLGRLHSLSLDVQVVNETAAQARDLVQTAVGAGGLEVLELSVYGNLAAPLVAAWAALSVSGDAHLKRLSYELSLGGGVRAPPLLDMLLERHAPTLEELAVGFGVRVQSALHLLCPNLRALRCPVLPDMEALLQCRRLEEVCFEWNYQSDCDQAAELRGVSAFLRSAAKRLRSVAILYDEPSRDDPHPLLSLATGFEPASVETLELSLAHRSSERDIASALPRLPHLAELTLRLDATTDGVPYALLTAVNLATAPNLVRLKLSLSYALARAWPCAHCWAHSAAVQGLLRRNPGLHVVRSVNKYKGDAPCMGGPCARRCHRFPQESGDIGLYAHGDGEECASQSSHRDKRVAWFRMRDDGP